jgi:uncharacterized RDD family membrane protein YckC
VTGAPPQVRPVPEAAPARQSAGSPAGLLLRVAAMIYDGVLLFGICFVAGFAVLALTGWPTPLDGARRLALQAAVFVAVGVYFCWCWHRSGQTLALKTWRLRVADAAGKNPALPRALARYALSWSMFLPGFAYVAVMQPAGAGGVAALAAGFVLMLLPALFDGEHRLLHDRLTGTRILRER